MNKIAIIIPAYNELENIEKLVKEIKKYVPKSTIFIVDDSKEDDVGKFKQKFLKNRKDLIY